MFQGAEDGAFAGDSFLMVFSENLGGGSSHPCPPRGETEIQQLDAGGAEHDVCRLEISMDDTVSMSLVQRVSNVNREPNHALIGVL
jgi:hypothetical protein